jgi:tRNA-2-methylthio-N6-dimethylallyladenosine synthase
MPKEWIVSVEVASDRMDRLVETVRNVARRQNLSLLGRSCEVLIEREARRGGEMLQARTRDFRTVLVPGDASMIGRYLTVQLTGTTGSTFTGSVIRERVPLPWGV